MKRIVSVSFLLVIFAVLLSVLVRLSSVDVGSDDAGSEIHAKIPKKQVPLKMVDPERKLEVNQNEEEPIRNRFSAEMADLIRGIHSGRMIRVVAGDEERNFLFRSLEVTTENFRISVGAHQDFTADFEVFEGREVRADGSLAEMAKLAVVNDVLSMAYTTEAGDFLIERTEDGRWVSRTLRSAEEGSTWGHWKCATSSHGCSHEAGKCAHEGGGIAGVGELSGDSPEPPLKDVEISVASEASTDPPIGGARVDHPYFRLGARYDASLKDINILMVSSKSQTGTSSNLSSRAANYFTYMASLTDVYERQLGLRPRIQEMVLIPSDSSEQDIESATIATDSSTQQLNFVRDWAATFRPQATYKWGHVMGWTNVDGAAGGTVGWAWINSYGSSSFGISVNEREWTWGVIVHELGHNVGANHTSGGAMNATVSKSSPQESFFTKNTGANFTAAKEIYDYMSLPGRSFVAGPAPLRNPDEMPFGVDDTISTEVNTPLTFYPLTNDLLSSSTWSQSNTSLSLVEVGQIFPKAAGVASVSGNQITFTPANGFTGNAWFSYTLRGNLGNGGTGWMHSADVVVTVGGDSTNPSLNPTLSTTTDVLEADFTGAIRINPLLNDQGKGRLWAGGVNVVTSVNGSAQAYSEEAFRLVSANLISGNGNITLEKAEVTRNSANAQDNTGYLVYTPGSNEPSQVVIQYTVADADGNQSTGTIIINRVDPRDIKATGTVIGSSGSYLNDPAWDKSKVFDNDLNTFYDGANANGDWVGLDLGAAKQISRIRFAPRSTWPSRMVGGQFQGSNTADFSSGVVTFYTVPSLPATGVLTQVAVNNTGTYRYVRYLSPNDGYCNVAEVEFHTEAAPATPVGLLITSAANGSVSLDWNNNAETDLTGYKVYRSNTPGIYGAALATIGTTSNYTDNTVANGTTYHYVVTAIDGEGYESGKSNEVSVTVIVNDYPPVVNAGSPQTVVIANDAPWTPSELNTTVGWYDASDASTITASGGAVSVWANKASENFNLVQDTSANRPATGTHSINGKNALKFNGSPQRMATATNPFGATVNNAFVIAVHRVDSTASNQTLFSLTGSETNASRWQAHAPWGASIYFDTGNASGANRVTGNYGVSVNSVVLSGFYGSTTDNVQQIYKNGSLLFGDATGHAVNTVGNVIVGSGGTNFQNTSIGEFIIVNGTVSADERQKLEGYLAHKWSLSADLPAAHPYRGAAPSAAGVTVNLTGNISDPDGDTFTALWSKVSGPGAVVFGNSTSVNTTATFTESGVYVLRLTANDGVFQTASDVTITVNATSPGYTLVYDGNGNSGGSVPVDNNSPYQDGNTVTVLGNTGSLVRTGHTFNNWNTAANGSGTSYAPGATFGITTSTTLYAQWTANVYTVTFNKQSGSGGTNAVNATFGAPVPAAAAPSRAGYTFLGYYTQASGAGVQVYGADMSSQGNWQIAANTTLYAHWIADPVVTAGSNQNATLGAMGLWSPSRISTAAWYDAADSNTISLVGGVVSAWADKSGNGNHAIQSTPALRPSSGTVSIGGLNAIAIRIDGTNKQFLSAPNTTSLNLDAAGGANVFAVMRYLGFVDNGSTALNVALGKGSLLSTSANYGIRISSSNQLGYMPASNGIVNTTAYTNQELLFSGTGDNAAKTSRIYVDGLLRNTASTASDFTSDNTSPFNIGRDSSTNRNANVDFGEIIVVGGALIDAERERLEGYLAHKWNRAGSLPANHPYKSVAPAGVGVAVNLNGNATGATTTQWALQSGPGLAVFGNASSANTTVSFTEAGTYVLRLTASNGVTQVYDEITIVVLPTGNMPPAAPTGLSATAGDSSIALGWDAHPDPAVASYTVYRSQGAGGNGFVAIATAVTDNFFTDETAPNDVTYLYRVSAVNDQSLESLPSSNVSAKAVGPLLVSEGPDGLIYQTYANEGQTNKVNTVPDYSRAGYQGGGVAIPFVPSAVTLTPSGGNDTTAIQNAINTVSALPLVDGFRGAIYLSAGNYTVSNTLSINASGVVIRGAGQQENGGTRITYTATTQSNLFHFHGVSNPAIVGGSSRDITQSYVPVGSRVLNVTDASSFAPGDMIRITNQVNQKWIDDIGMTEAGGLTGGPDDPAWDPAQFQLQHYRYVVGVNGNQLTLDAPIVQAIETQYGGGRVEKATFVGAIENIGIENIRLESTFAGDEDENHGWVAVEMRRVKNGWVRQATGRYFGMGLVFVTGSSQFVTVEDCAMLDAKSISTGGRKYSFHVDDASYVLMQRNLARGGRHDFVTGSVTPGPNVFADGLAINAIEDIGPHFRYATGELYDNIKSDGEMNVQNRLNAGTSHGWSGAQVMFWNVDASTVRIDAPTGAMNWSIGTVGTKSPGPSFMAPWEPFGIWQSHGTPVGPRSLYLAQLEDRLGFASLRNVTLPEQNSGRIWSELQAWGGNGLLLSPVLCWREEAAPGQAIPVHARIRDLTILQNLTSTTWSKVSGPGDVSFGNAAAYDTTASFSQAGTYEIRFTATDGGRQVMNSMTIDVNLEGEIADTNSNGIDDAWEMSNFGRMLNGGEVVHESGVSYYFMYLHGTNLADPADRFQVSAVPGQGGVGVAFVWELLEGFEMGTHYEVQISTNLTQWNSIPTEHRTIQETPVGSRTRMQLTLTHDYGSRVFIRLAKP